MGLLWRIVANKFGMLIIGVAALGFGIFQMNQTEVTCGGEVMQAGDECENTKRGRTVSVNSFEEEKESQALAGKILTGVGGALTLGGAGWIIVSMTRRKPEEAPAA